MGTETFVTLTTLLSAEDWSAKVTGEQAPAQQLV
jgi:hypothetical protein